MRIGQLQKQSFIDWEGKLTAVIFTRGCNFRCGYCHNPSLVLPELFASSPDVAGDEILAFLKSRTGWLDGVVITGGEPTVQPDLKAFIIKIKQLGFAVKLDTNGTNPALLKELIEERRIDFVAMDIKSVFVREEYEKVTGIRNASLFNRIRQSVEILKQHIIPCQFRTTVLPGIHSDEMIRTLKDEFGKGQYSLQAYRDDFETVNTYIPEIHKEQALV